ncbi:DUF6777 domain-containing protein [Streptomyces sp. YU58]|uniref:DUF6777 domain-containing protein n=1 Tax=Streptomyces sp. SX92 TaxID=3158972 RepID=UPI0027BA752C|nr:DUF6777 domain-containing protein [Streptomyces coralus]WLW57751.1 hypothetical protein QU709_43105 [Streptomyces coralus]
MSAEPPSSGRPTGPPSGPLSGPSQPPPGGDGPPSQPPSGDGAPPPEPHRAWWRSVPRIAVVATAVVAAVVLAVVFTRSDGGGGSGAGSGGEVFLQAAGKAGPDPFTESTATDSSAPPISASPTSEAPTNAVRGVDGGAPGLYGGTRNVASCDVEKQITALKAAPAKNRAFASVAGVAPSQVPAHLRALTPVQLRMDTRVTNHGYRDGSATSYQAVLQSGTAVLVDERGVPRVRCACGNPLTPPVAQQTTPKHTGDTWSSYRPANVVVVAPSTTVINIFVIYDPDGDHWIGRHRGDTGGKDHKTDPPKHHPSPSVSVTTPTSPPPSSPAPCVSTNGDATPGLTPGVTETPTGSASPCPPTSTAPSAPLVSPESPSPDSSDPGTTEPESPESSAPSPPLASDTTETGTTQSASTPGTPGPLTT